MMTLESQRWRKNDEKDDHRRSLPRHRTRTTPHHNRLGCLVVASLFFFLTTFPTIQGPVLVGAFVTSRTSPRTSRCFSSSSGSPTTQPPPPPIDAKYYSPPPPDSPTVASSSVVSRITLRRFLSNKVKEQPQYQDLQNILLALELSCKTISNLVNRAGLVYSIQNDMDEEDDNDEKTTGKTTPAAAAYSDGRYYSMKRLDKLSTNVLKNALKFTGTVELMTPPTQLKSEEPHEHQPGVLIASDNDSNFVACLDPLDGSGNADASICTGTVFGVFRRSSHNSTTTKNNNNNTTRTDLQEAVLQPARNMRAAGYCLYSSATVLVFTFGSGVFGFTLDPQIQEFVLTHPNLTIPPRGNVYSCNEANSEGWNQPWKDYLKALKLGQGETKTRYAHRYVGSMVGDIHRTLLYGGVFGYPSDAIDKPRGNLQLLYKSAPMAFVVHHAGGKAMDEEGNDLLDQRPERIHQKSPCFMGSPQDLDELATYLVPQKKNKQTVADTKSSPSITATTSSKKSK